MLPPQLEKLCNPSWIGHGWLPHLPAVKGMAFPSSGGQPCCDRAQKPQFWLQRALRPLHILIFQLGFLLSDTQI